ncbi:hypothetical protein SAMN05216388_1005151 [Halorientalis persicus]|uniref:Uncharacterized protein n=1 Tax=Halorientalis persicus TaxID=1367881 RepID=A0A1H8JQP4_9EURY|nr:hypothetical protein [Halorientalis persicus]SEN83060.1 hypothetical protein SAMN05216388_1005151 [Halorientalis persicus]
MSALPLTPARRDALTCAFALVLLAAPLWSLPLGLGERVHEYERAAVTVNGSTIEYATEIDDTPDHTPISDEIGCSGDFDTRICAFESHLAANHSIPTEWQSRPDSSNYTSLPGRQRYRYVRVDGRIYEATYTTGDPTASGDETHNGLVRIYLAQKPVSPWETLEDVSIDADDVSPTVRTAARTGSANHTAAVEVPETPVRIDGGYYRVYESSVRERSALAGFFRVLLCIVAPAVGLGLLVSLRGRFRLTHVSQAGEQEE